MKFTIMKTIFSFLWCFLGLVILVGTPLAKNPTVMVTVKPLHSLVASMMEGVGQPLLLGGVGSPHERTLRPSGVRQLYRARLVLWGGAMLEPQLRKVLQGLPDRVRVVSMNTLPGQRLLAPRPDDWWRNPNTASQVLEPAQIGADKPVDPHIWLDPLNARAIVRGLARVLAELMPEHQKTLAANRRQLESALAALHGELSLKLAPVARLPFIQFHDGLQYFEQRYGLNSIAALTPSPELAPGARKLLAIRELIRAEAVRCVFTESPFPPRLVKVVVEGSRARIGELDPLGTTLAEGPELYFTLMRQLAEAIAGCLDAGRKGG